MLATLIPLTCVLTLDAATVQGADVAAAIDVLGEAILAAHKPGSHWDPPKMPSGESTRQHLGGYTALATLALLTAGHDAQSKPLCDAIAWLEGIEPDGTYAVAFRAQVWAALPDRYLPSLQRDVDRLIESFHWEQGGWDYLCRPVKRIPRVSPSTRHVAILALHAATARGLDVPRPLLERVEQATIGSQHADGGWSYYEGEASSGSMTSAGVFSLMMVEDLLGPAKDRRAVAAREHAMNRGLAWLNERFVPVPCPGGGRCAKFPQYWLYALERLALATGTRTLAGRDWLRDAVCATLDRLCRRSAEGVWQVVAGESTSKLRQRCFGLMLLHRAAAPLACAHVDLGDSDPSHAASLVHRLEHAFEQQTTWQSISMADPVDVWLESPMVLATGGAPPGFLRTHGRAIAAAVRTGQPTPGIPEVEKTAAFLNRGGLLVAIAESGGFAKSIRQIAALAAPTGSWSRAGKDHPARSLLRPPRSPPRVETFDRGGRTLVLLISGKPEEVLPNVWAMATERAPFPTRLDVVARPTHAAADDGITVTFAGDAYEPGAPAAFESWCQAAGHHVRCRSAPLANAHDTHGLVVVATPDVAKAWSEIDRLLRSGRVVLVTPPNGFEQQARDAAAGITLRPPHAAAWMDGISATWRPYSRQQGRQRPGLDVRVGQMGGGELILADSDLLQAVLDRPTWGVHGHDAATARAVLLALARHADKPLPPDRQLPAEAVAATMPP